MAKHKEPKGFRIVLDEDGHVKVAGPYHGCIPMNHPQVLTFETEDEMLDYIDSHIGEPNGDDSDT